MAEPAHKLAASPEKPDLWSAGFIGLVVSQFLNAANDNIFRWLVVGIGKYFVPQQEALILAGGLAVFTIPYIVLAAHAGYLSDRFSKRSVLVGCKIAEAAIVILGLAAIWLQSLPGLFVVLTLLGCRAALSSPAKLGAIPELVRPEQISAANGLMGLTTVIAIILGTALGNYLSDWTGPDGRKRLWLSALVLLGVAVAGLAAAMRISRLPAADPGLSFPSNVLGRTLHDLRALATNRPMFRVALGILFFWSIGSLAQLNIDQLGAAGHLSRPQVVPLLVALVVGVGIGSALAGTWSAGRVELGILPLGAGGMALSSLLLFTVDGSLATGEKVSGEFYWAGALLFALGLSAGLFSVPLSAYMQHRSPAQSRGAILAASNLLTFSGILLASGLFWLLRRPLANGQPWWTPQQIFLLAGLATIPVFVYVVRLLPQASLRFFVWLLSRTIYRIRVVGRDNLPATGGALLIPNHVSWVDGILLLLTSSRLIRMVVYADYVETWWVRWMARTMEAIPIKPGRRSVVESLRTAREALREGDLVCIFPEGGLTRTGGVGEFKPGFLSIVKGTQCPVVPVYLDGLWGSIFSFEGGKCFWKWPKRWPLYVTISFGRPLDAADSVDQVRQAVMQLGEQTVQQPALGGLSLPRAMLRMARRHWKRPKVADSTNTEMTGGEMLVRTLIVRRLLSRLVLSPDERFVGLLLPPSAGGVLANAALALSGRVAVNLNYTLSGDVINSCIRQCGIRHVLTSRRVMERLEATLDAELVFVEDFREQVTTFDKLTAFAMARLTPMPLLERWLNLTRTKPDDLLTVVFTSGSTGEPKGVMLSHGNVASNVQAIDEIVRLSDTDVLLGILPFFHSMGYTTTLWTVLALDPKGVYHFNPLDGRTVGELSRKHGTTIIIAAPTFLRTYLRRCEKEDFARLNCVVAGAEKLPKDLCDAFEAKFGVRPVEGYGCTELSPLVSVNVPPTRARGPADEGIREGTVGRPVPGVRASVRDPDTGAELGTDQPGMLWIAGPNVMQGYLHKPELTAQVVQDGWYNTGDIAQLDERGFITITGRLSRFSKIGGEMVPHLKIEETLQRVIGAGEDELKAAVTAVPDARKGERLVVIHTDLGKSPDAICRELKDQGLPALWIPSPDNFCRVPEIPVLGTGKLDLKRLKDLALEKFGAERGLRLEA